MKVKLLSRARLLGTPWTAAYQAPPSMGFSRQEYWSGVPLPSPASCLERANSDSLLINGASLVAQMVKNLPVVQEIWVHYLGLEDSLEKEMATHSSILAWETSWTEEPGGLQSIGSKRV